MDWQCKGRLCTTELGLSTLKLFISMKTEDIGGTVTLHMGYHSKSASLQLHLRRQDVTSGTTISAVCLIRIYTLSRPGALRVSGIHINMKPALLLVVNQIYFVPKAIQIQYRFLSNETQQYNTVIRIVSSDQEYDIRIPLSSLRYRRKRA